MRRLLKWLGVSLLLLLAIIAGPILYVETMCRGEALTQEEAIYVTETRPEARTYMVYPEWHIVYAYEGYAEALKGLYHCHFRLLVFSLRLDGKGRRVGRSRFQLQSHNLHNRRVLHFGDAVQGRL